MSENIINNGDEITQEEYTFPNLIPTSKCEELLQAIKKQFLPHKIIFWIAFGAFMLFMILTGVLADSEFSKEMWAGTSMSSLQEYKANYTGAIICAVLWGISIIVGIVNIVTSSKYGKYLNYLNSSIKINSQYANFINQGYDKKEAYKLTLEWIDRQANIAAINSVSASSALIAMSNLNRH